MGKHDPSAGCIYVCILITLHYMCILYMYIHVHPCDWLSASVMGYILIISSLLSRQMFSEGLLELCIVTLECLDCL